MTEKISVTDFHDTEKAIKINTDVTSFNFWGLPPSILNNLKKLGAHTPTSFQTSVIQSVFSSNEFDFVIQYPQRESSALALGVAVAMIVSDLKIYFRIQEKHVMTPLAVILFGDEESCKINGRQFTSIGSNTDLRYATVQNGNASRLKCDVMLSTYEVFSKLIQKKCINVSGIQLIVVDCHDSFVDFDADQIEAILNKIDPTKRMVRILYASRIFLNSRDKLLKCLRKDVHLIRPEVVERRFIPPLSSERRMFLQRRLTFHNKGNVTPESRRVAVTRNQSFKGVKPNPQKYTRGSTANGDVYTDDGLSDSD